MKKIVCEMCDGTEFLKQDGLFVCQTCGMKYSMEEARKMMVDVPDDGTSVPVAAPAPAPAPDNSAVVANYLTLAQNAIDSSNNEEAENYANKIIELDPQNSRAWLIKGEAAGWQSKANNNRVGEAVLAWQNAIRYAGEDEAGEVRETVSNKFFSLIVGMISLRTSNFGTIQSDDNLGSLKRDVEQALKLMNDLTFESGVAFNRGKIYEMLASKINGGAVAGFKDASGDFGPEHRNMAKWQWERFTKACDNCIAVLEQAAALVRTPSLARTIYENMNVVGTSARDSCSWKFDVNAWTADHYVQEYSFTESAKKVRSDMISGYAKKKEELGNSVGDKALRKIRSGRSEEEKKRGWRRYWEEHQEEKEQLDAEKKQLTARVVKIGEEIRTLPAQEQVKTAEGEAAKLASEISELCAQIATLGIFKGKEKKALQAKVDELRVEQDKKASALTSLKASADEAAKPLNEEKDQAMARLREIEHELVMERALVEEEESILIPGAMADGKFAVTPRMLVEHLQKHLTDPLYLGELRYIPARIHSSLEKDLSVAVRDKTISGDNQNAGVSIHFDADGEDEPIRFILIETSKAHTVEKAALYIPIATLVIRLICEEAERDSTEQMISEIMYDTESALYGAIS